VQQLDIQRQKSHAKKGTLPSLEPVYSNNPDVVREVQSLKEENQQWADKLARVQAQVEEVIQERERLAMELDSAVINLESLKNTQLQGEVHPQQDAHLMEVESRLTQEQAQLVQKAAEVEEMRNRKDSMVVQESAQFKELKKVIAKKNMQLKELRQRLARYEPDDDDALVAED
jgi:leucine zipper transcription factor-like protein 1